jgi:DNA-binding FadR family transcriptional regulator
MDNQNVTIALPRKRSRSLAQEVMNDISEKIRRGLYKPGETLPTEPEVMVEQGVSRTVVREAMSRLQAAGFVETRHGIGTFVLPTAAPTVPSPDLASVVTIRDVIAMLELRISLETEAAGLAAQRRTDEHLALMQRAVDAFEENISKGESSVDADFQFHLQIALATDNKYFEDFYRHLGTTTIPRTRLDTTKFSPEPSQSYLFRTNREHQYILDAITRKDPEMARASMRMHLSNSSERLKRASEAADQQAAATRDAGQAATSSGPSDSHTTS